MSHLDISLKSMRSPSHNQPSKRLLLRYFSTAVMVLWSTTSMCGSLHTNHRSYCFIMVTLCELSFRKERGRGYFCSPLPSQTRTLDLVSVTQFKKKFVQPFPDLGFYLFGNITFFLWGKFIRHHIFSIQIAVSPDNPINLMNTHQNVCG